MELVVIDLNDLSTLTSKVRTAGHRFRALQGEVTGLPIPPMRPEDAAPVRDAIRQAASILQKAPALLEALADDLHVRLLILQRDLIAAGKATVGPTGLALGVWSGLDKTLERTVAAMQRKHGSAAQTLRALKTNPLLAKDGLVMTQIEAQQLKKYQRKQAFWDRWLRRVDAAKRSRFGKLLAQFGKKVPWLAPVFDVMQQLMDSDALTTPEGKLASGGTFAGLQILFGARSPVVALVDSYAASKSERYQSISIAQTNSSTGLGAGAFVEYGTRGDLTGLQNVHRDNISGTNGFWAQFGGNAGDVTSGYIDMARGSTASLEQYQAEALAGQRGTVAENTALAGETTNEMIRNPIKSAGEAFDYWKSVF